MNDGLKEKHRQAIIDILAAHKGVERAVLFGSRAMGTFTATSDVDIVLFGDGLSLDDQARLAREIDLMPIPQRVDLLRYRTIKDKKLRAHIRKHGVEWFSQTTTRKTRSGEEKRRLGVGNDGFTTEKLGPLCSKIGSGATPRGGSKVYLDKGDIALIRSQNVYNDGFNREGLVYITVEHAEKLSNVTVKHEDVLLNITGDSVARCCQVDPHILPARVNQHVSIIRPKHDELIPRFLRYFLISPTMQVQMLSWAHAGATRKALTKGMIESFEIPKPDLTIQKRIAQILGTLDDKIELNRRMNQTLEKMAAAIFKSWFIDFNPVRAKADGQDTGLPKEIADLFPDSFEDSELGEIPKGWTPGALADIANNPRRSIKPEEVPPTTPYIGLQDMPRRCIALDSWGRVDEVGSQKSRFSAGEILFGKLRPYFHKVGIAPVSGVCSTDILVIVVKENAWHSYVLSLVSSKAFVDYTDTHSGGTKMPRTNWKDMGRYPLALPPIELAQAFQDYVAPLHQRIGVSVRQNRRLARLRDTLLPKLLSGELELPAIEAVEEGAE